MGRRKRDWTLEATFVSLRQPNYGIYFVTQIVSTMGIWVQLVAETWLVVELSSGSGLALGIANALTNAPVLLLGLYAGVLVDRINTRRMLVATQSAAGLLALVLWVLSITGLIRLWMIWIAVLLVGVINSVDVPARQAFTKELVGREHVANAVALNNGVTTAARMLGPAAGGLLIVATDVSVCFLVNALSFALVVVALLLLNVGALFAGEPVARRPGQIREGLAYVRGNPRLRTVVMLMFLVFTFGYNFQVLLPLLASQTFGGDSSLYGYLMSAMGIGALAGSLFAASQTRTGTRAARWTSVLLAMALGAVATAPGPLAGAGAAALMGATSSLFVVICSSTLQTESEEDVRGRVMSLFSIAFLGTGAIGGPVIGGIAEAFGPRTGFIVGALACVAAAGLGRHPRNTQTVG